MILFSFVVPVQFPLLHFLLFSRGLFLLHFDLSEYLPLFRPLACNLFLPSHFYKK
nr:MAG TPA: hypothetical protein [Caudoviricetes sp.]